MGARIESRDGRPPLDDRRRSAARNRLTTGGAERAGQERRAARRTARVRTHTRWSKPARRGIIRSARWTRSACTVDARRRPVVEVDGGQRLQARNAHGARATSRARRSGPRWPAARPGPTIDIDGVGLNPSRIAVLEVFGAPARRRLVVDDEERAGEPVGHRCASRFARLRELQRSSRTRCRCVIDEIPALAALAAMMPAGRTFTVRGAGELRVKESDRISALAAGFRAMGAAVEEYDDGFTLEARPLSRRHGRCGRRSPARDGVRRSPRRAPPAPTTITGASSVDVSYPGSSTSSRGSRGDGRQDLPRRLHGGRQDDRRPRARRRGSAGAPRTSTS